MALRIETIIRLIEREMPIRKSWLRRRIAIPHQKLTSKQESILDVSNQLLPTRAQQHLRDKA